MNGSRPEPTDPDRRRILVVDDNPATLYSTSRVLRAAGFDVLEGRNGSEGLALASASVDLVLLDVNMPDLTGFQVCEALRKRPDTARLPIVQLSATFVSDQDKVVALDAGVDGYLTHPVEPKVLVATINAFLRTRTAEERLRRSEARFRAVFDHVPGGIALVGSDLVFLEVNAALCGLLGRSPEELVGRPITDPLSDADRARVAEAAGFAGDGQWTDIVTIARPDGRALDLEWVLSVHAEPGVSLLTATDVTERRQIDAARERILAGERAARTEAERANRMKDDFLATLSHELRNPLNAILGWAMVLRRKHGDSDLAPALETIERNARVQSQLISDLLDVSSITSGKLRLDRTVVDPVAVVDAALTAVKPLVEAKRIGLERDVPVEVGMVTGDAARLQQVIWNLLSNAVKFTATGGHVSVRLRRVGDAVVLSVRDDGKGIAADFLPHIFERFRQEDASSTKAYHGLGLGLAIVKNLVDMHDGTVAATSDGEGRGATFTVSLPAAVDGEAPHPAPLPGRIHLEGLRVLIVEDDPDARELIARVLTEAGAVVRDADGMRSALRDLPEFHPQVVVSDIGMPGHDGYELIREVRALGYDGVALPAIALTAFARSEDRRDALAAGYQLHLGKPIDPAALVSAVASLAPAA